MKQSRIFAGLLAVLMLAGTSCGGTESQTPKETEQKTGETTAETVTEEPIIDPAAFVPDVFYDDTDFTVLYWNAWAWGGGSSINEIAPEEVEGGDIINEALLERNRKTEEKLGVRIKAVAAQQEIITSEIEKSVMAEDNAYDAVCAALPQMYNCALKQLIVNLADVETLDLSHAWWDRKAYDTLNFGKDRDIVYFMSGDINYLDNYGTECIFVNKSLLSRLDMDLPYDLVREHKWTLDTMLSMCRDTYSDLDMDGKHSFDDRYGLVGSVNLIEFFMVTEGQQQIIKDADGSYVVNDSETFYTVLDKLHDSFRNSEDMWFDGGDYTRIFFNENAVFNENLLSGFRGYSSNMEDDLTVIPFPLWDETQKEYLCCTGDYGTAYGILLTTDTERAGYVLDVMGAYSPDTVTEAVIEKTCKVKAARDEDTAEMVSLILQSASISFGTVVNWNGISSYYSWLVTRENNYASSVARQKNKIEKLAQKNMEILQNPLG